MPTPSGRLSHHVALGLVLKAVADLLETPIPRISPLICTRSQVCPRRGVPAATRRLVLVLVVLLATLGQLSLAGAGHWAQASAVRPVTGYWLAASDGGVFALNSSFHGSAGAIHLNQPIVAIASTPDGNGYWLVASDGGIFTYGDARFFGSSGSLQLKAPVVGMASTPDGGGYWLVASDGGIFSYGDARFYGSTGSISLNKPVVGMAADPSTGGYWLVASDGGIFSFNAAFYGSTGSISLNKPVVGMEASPSGGGYWFVASDGGVFNYGDASFFGSTGSVALNQPIVGMATTTVPLPGPSHGDITRVWTHDFPDPFILNAGSTYYAYGTNATYGPNASFTGNIQMLTSPDLVHWAAAGSGVVQLPPWSEQPSQAEPGETWSPGVIELHGKFLMYYSVWINGQTSQMNGAGHCISVAVASQPQGPFVDNSSGPFICQSNLNGSIDPYPFVDPSGIRYLLWKSNGVGNGDFPLIWAQQLAPDGLGLRGSPAPLVAGNLPWEGTVIEGPAMQFHNGTYYLFFGADLWFTANASIGYTTCASPIGPCATPAPAPWLAAKGSGQGSLVGPSGPGFVTDGSGQVWLSFHGWTDPNISYQGFGERSLYMTPVNLP